MTSAGTQFHLGPEATDARPVPVFRLGVTGHRKLDDAASEALTASVGAVLDALHAGAERAFADQRQVLNKDAPMIAQCVSSLAHGADSLVALSALSRGWRIAAPLPFHRELYERDFGGRTDLFHTLLRAADSDQAVIELDGRRDTAEQEDDAYLAAGLTMLRHADVVIAIWDGERRAGVGTWRIVAEALTQGLTVIHVNAMAPHTTLVLKADETPIEIADPALLEEIAYEAIYVPLNKVGERAAARYLRDERIEDCGEAPDYYFAGPFRPKSRLSHGILSPFHRWLMRQAKRPAPYPFTQVPPPPGFSPVFRSLYLHYHRADRLAAQFAEAHRGLYVAIFGLGCLALISAVVAIAAKTPMFESPALALTATLLEFSALAATVGLLAADTMLGLRQRWLDYRLLAELMRGADLTSLTGRSIRAQTLRDLQRDLPERARWVPGYVAAAVRAAGVPGARYDDAYLDATRAFAIARIQDQINYHRRTSIHNRNVNAALRFRGVALFILTFAAVASKIAITLVGGLALPAVEGGALVWTVHESKALADALLLAAAVLPAVAYAILGIRNQTEFEIIGGRSERLTVRFERFLRRLAAPGRGSAGYGLESEALGREIGAFATVIQQDAADWSAIFETKETSAA